MPQGLTIKTISNLFIECLFQVEQAYQYENLSEHTCNNAKIVNDNNIEYKQSIYCRPEYKLPNFKLYKIFVLKNSRNNS